MYAEQKGRREGKEEGEKLAALKIARQLLDGLDVEMISAKTGLSLAEIQALR